MTLSWCFEDESDVLAEQVLESLTESEALAPAIWFSEVANGLLAAERRKRIAAARVDECLSVIKSLPVVIAVSADSFDLLRLARQTGLSVYDASYLQLAVRHGVPLATRDRALRLAAERVGVAMFAAGR